MKIGSIVIVAAVATTATSLRAASIGLSTTTPYTQDFNGLATSGSSNTFDSTTPIAGFYSSRSTYAAGTGSSATGALYSFGSASDTDRALGSVASSGTGTVLYGAEFSNATTGSTLTSLSVTYTGEQWRNSGNTAAQTLSFEYSTTATPTTFATATFLAGPATLDFVSPKTGATAGALDGNAAGNRTTLTGTISGLAIAPGASVFIRFSDPDDAGSDHGLAVDDLSVSATFVPIATPVPEPIAAAGGVALLGGVVLRRRRPLV